MNKSIRKPINKIKKSIQVNRKGGKKDNIIYLKGRYSYHYKKNNWKRAEEYNQYSLNNYDTNLRDWMENKEIKDKNLFGFSNQKKIRYG